MSGAEILFAVAASTAAYGTVQAGRAQAFQYKAEAQQAKMQARDVEIARRQKLLQALAERQVATAAGGATLEGSPMAIINESERQANLDRLALEGMTASKVSTLNAAARNARTVANITAAAELMAAGSKIAGGGGGGAGAAKGASASGSVGGAAPGAMGRVSAQGVGSGGAGLIPR